MALLIMKMSISLDGYFAPADGSSGWEAAGRPDDGARWVRETRNAETHLVGAATYRGGPVPGRARQGRSPSR